MKRTLGSIDVASLGKIESELKRRKDFLIRISHNLSIPMDPLDRDCIQNFFERGESPAKPADIAGLLKLFFTSCFTYAPLRKFLISIAGSIPTAEMLPHCLSKVYHESRFLDDENWYPDELYALAQAIQNRDKYDLKSNQFKPRMIAVLLSGSKEMSARLRGGLNHFYGELEKLTHFTSDHMWAYVEDFSEHIYI
jgi:hypothetical protein